MLVGERNFVRSTILNDNDISFANIPPTHQSTFVLPANDWRLPLLSSFARSMPIKNTHTHTHTNWARREIVSPQDGSPITSKRNGTERNTGCKTNPPPIEEEGLVCLHTVAFDFQEISFAGPKRKELRFHARDD